MVLRVASAKNRKPVLFIEAVLRMVLSGWVVAYNHVYAEELVFLVF